MTAGFWTAPYIKHCNIVKRKVINDAVGYACEKGRALSKKLRFIDDGIVCHMELTHSKL